MTPRVSALIADVSGWVHPKSGVLVEQWVDRITPLNDDELIELIAALHAAGKIQLGSEAAIRSADALLRQRWTKASDAIMKKTLWAAIAALLFAILSAGAAIVGLLR